MYACCGSTLNRHSEKVYSDFSCNSSDFLGYLRVSKTTHFDSFQFPFALGIPHSPKNS